MKRFFIGGVVVCSLLLSSGVPAYDDGDVQFWNSNGVVGKLSERWQIQVDEEFRFGKDMEELYYYHTDAGFVFKVSSKFTLGLNYRHVTNLIGDNKWEVEHRPHINGTFKWSWGGINFSNRGRFELRIRPDRDNQWRFRDKLSMAVPFQFDSIKLSPYIADEPYYDFDAEEWNRNRIYGGVNVLFMKHFETELYYMLQSSKSKDKWSDINVSGLKLKYRF